jgi:hypothetical protein
MTYETDSPAPDRLEVLAACASRDPFFLGSRQATSCGTAPTTAPWPRPWAAPRPREFFLDRRARRPAYTRRGSLSRPG